MLTKMEQNQRTFIQSLKRYDGQEYLLRYLTYAVSAVLKRVKPAELVTLKNQGCNCLDTWCENGQQIQKILGVCCMELQKNNDSISLLFYDPDMLLGVIVRNKNSPLLVGNGYPVIRGLCNMLLHLKQRFDIQDFPHEIGLFLGYPPLDVEAFIKNNARDYCGCHYWKVYHDMNQAHELRTRIDSARKHAANLLLSTAVYQTVAILCS